jgi:hypothetical protein
MMRGRFESWRKPLDAVLLGIPEERADRALKEMGAVLRALDDLQKVGEELERRGDPPLGFVINQKGGREDLYLRDMTNKILHARGFEWRDDAELGPVVRCVAKDGDRWTEAEIRVDRLLGLCSEIALG